MSVQINNLPSHDENATGKEVSGMSHFLPRNQDHAAVFEIESKASLIPDDESVLELDADVEYNYVDGDDDDDDDDDDNEDEDLIVKGMVEAAFSGRMTNDELKRILQRDDDDNDGPIRKKGRFTTGDDNIEQRRQSIPKSVSSDSLQNTNTNSSSRSNRSRYGHPSKFLRHLLESVSKEYQLFSASDVKDFFVQLTEENIVGYDSELVTALYTNDVTKLRTMLDAGHTMQCGNKFGETIIHTACRRGLYDVLQFLIADAGVSIQVVCDSGRTPLHDACWTTKPNWNIINLLLNNCPDLLYITDNRGYTPLDYIPKQLWNDWCDFLDRRGVNGLQRQTL
jgi:hypothetical protein